ncbi:MAG: ADP-ribosylglycohydrolase family protein [Limnobacter sp.]|uniref:ADP-ribosylglycohydrolase family protein n=1 Tax=Limnobacter sp. TaxID=2003368 RepID=UPI003918A365
MHINADLLKHRIEACLVLGAYGDALGAPVEFLNRGQILAQYTPTGIRSLSRAYGRVGAITDDTQMTLFTAEGLLRACLREMSRGVVHAESVVDYAYLRWLGTQGVSTEFTERALESPSFLVEALGAYVPRAPGNTCIGALHRKTKVGSQAENDSKGNGGVMRIAPVAALAAAKGLPAEWVFTVGCQLAGLTHGHPTGKVASGFFAVLIYMALRSESGDLRQITIDCLTQLENGQLPTPAENLLGIEETSEAVSTALELSKSGHLHLDLPEELGQGWVAEEAVAIALYSALLNAPTDHDRVCYAVNITGDSDSTGSMCGQILGALHGPRALNGVEDLETLEHLELVRSVAHDLYNSKSWSYGDGVSNVLFERYPPT